VRVCDGDEKARRGGGEAEGRMGKRAGVRAWNKQNDIANARYMAITLHSQPPRQQERELTSNASMEATCSSS
jgi:hypothetical protein